MTAAAWKTPLANATPRSGNKRKSGKKKSTDLVRYRADIACTRTYNAAAREGPMFENNWRALYKAAVLETDPVKLELRVKAVEDAIRVRQSLDGQVSIEERAAMREALDSLGVLKLEWDKRTK